MVSLRSTTGYGCWDASGIGQGIEPFGEAVASFTQWEALLSSRRMADGKGAILSLPAKWELSEFMHGSVA